MTKMNDSEKKELNQTLEAIDQPETDWSNLTLANTTDSYLDYASSFDYGALTGTRPACAGLKNKAKNKRDKVRKKQKAQKKARRKNRK